MMSEYIIPCIASFFLGVGVMLIWVGLNFKEPAEMAERDKAPVPEVIGYDQEGKDK
ncbi:hypothetical protein [Pectinatus frisingensis]|uniref:hypothetical protein n=1 Tax=Pectinatus frisingensis TaxID=865 RepID=UPI003D805209